MKKNNEKGGEKYNLTKMLSSLLQITIPKTFFSGAAHPCMMNSALLTIGLIFLVTFCDSLRSSPLTLRVHR